MRRLLQTLLGSDDEAGKVVESMATEEVKTRLRDNTQEAFEKGAFGLPWFVGK